MLKNIMFLAEINSILTNDQYNYDFKNQLTVNEWCREKLDLIEQVSTTLKLMEQGQIVETGISLNNKQVTFAEMNFIIITLMREINYQLCQNPLHREITTKIIQSKREQQSSIQEENLLRWWNESHDFIGYFYRAKHTESSQRHFYLAEMLTPFRQLVALMIITLRANISAYKICQEKTIQE